MKPSVFFFSLAAPIFCLGVAAGASHHEHKYSTYCNDRFGYVISYPTNVLYPQGEADNRDGQIFLTKNAEAKLTVFGQYNANDTGIADMYDEDSRGGLQGDPKKVVTYSVLKSNWYVVSGVDVAKEFYQKTIVKNGTIYTMLVEYPAKRHGYFDPIVAHISSSFSVIASKQSK